MFICCLLFHQTYSLSSDEEDEEPVPDKKAKSTEKSKKASVDSGDESDKSDVQATRALIQKLSPAKSSKTLQDKVRFLLKGATSRITQLEKAGKFFQVCHSSSVLISLSRNHPCLVLVNYYFFGVFLT